MRRVAITGIGITSSIGNNVDEVTQSLIPALTLRFTPPLHPNTPHPTPITPFPPYPYPPPLPLSFVATRTHTTTPPTHSVPTRPPKYTDSISMTQKKNQ